MIYRPLLIDPFYNLIDIIVNFLSKRSIQIILQNKTIPEKNLQIINDKFMKRRRAYKQKYQIFNSKTKSANKVEEHDKIARRTPYSVYEDSRAKSMIENNFVSSTTTRQSKIDIDIIKTKTRLLTSTCQLKPNIVNLDGKHSEVYIKVPHKKKISIKNNADKGYPDQRLFNNFKLFDVSYKNTRHFSKYLPRKTKTESKIQYRDQMDSFKIGKTKEMLVYNHMSMSCVFSYSNKIYPQDKIKTQPQIKDIEFEQLENARQKCSKHKQVCQFYRFTGRQTTSSFQRRFNNLSQNKFCNKSNQETSALRVQRINRQLNEARLKQFDKKRKLYFKRGEICDKKYFKLPPQQQK